MLIVQPGPVGPLEQGRKLSLPPQMLEVLCIPALSERGVQ